MNLTACRQGPDYVTTLINAGARLNIKDNNGYTVLNYGTKKYLILFKKFNLFILKSKTQFLLKRLRHSFTKRTRNDNDCTNNHRSRCNIKWNNAN